MNITLKLADRSKMLNTFTDVITTSQVLTTYTTPLELHVNTPQERDIFKYNDEYYIVMFREFDKEKPYDIVLFVEKIL